MNTDSYESKSISQIRYYVQTHLGWNKTRSAFLVNFVLALIKVRTVCLTEIATAFPGKAQIDSKYKTLQRFFRFFEVNFDSFARFLGWLVPLSSEKPWLLTIDRTNWKFGKANINIFMLGVAYQGIAFPLLWVPLNKAGNSNTKERIELMKRFINVFGKNRIQTLTADRESVGHDWFKWLIEEGISFSIRIRHNFKVISSKGNEVAIKELFKNLRVGETRILRGLRVICGVELHITGTKLRDGSYLIVVTNTHPEIALDDYKKRLEIETLFGCLKSRGFDFESTHITAPDKIMKLIALLAVAFCWCHLTGEWKSRRKPIKAKRHGRKAMSLFRYGLDALREALFNSSYKANDFKELCGLLIAPLRTRAGFTSALG